MARIVNGGLQAPGHRVLTEAQRREAARRIAKAARENPLRRVRLACHGPVRDSTAVVGDWIWCDQCGDVARVDSLTE
jgi:hypothetical protein